MDFVDKTFLSSYRKSFKSMSWSIHCYWRFMSHYTLLKNTLNRVLIPLLHKGIIWQRLDFLILVATILSQIQVSRLLSLGWSSDSDFRTLDLSHPPQDSGFRVLETTRSVLFIYRVEFSHTLLNKKRIKKQDKPRSYITYYGRLQSFSTSRSEWNG